MMSNGNQHLTIRWGGDASSAMLRRSARCQIAILDRSMTAYGLGEGAMGSRDSIGTAEGALLSGDTLRLKVKGEAGP